MAIGDQRLSIFTVSAAIAAAVLAYQPDLAARDIAPRTKAAAPVQPTSHLQDDRPAINRLAMFLERWTNTVETTTVGSDH